MSGSRAYRDIRRRRRKRDGVERLVGKFGRPGIGDQEALRQHVRRPPVDHAHDLADHALDDALTIIRRKSFAQREIDAEALRDLQYRFLDARHALGAILDDEPSADCDRDGGEDFAFLDQGEFGGAAADIDIEHGVGIAARHRDGAGAVRGHLAFHVMAGGRADECP